jgi:hypothetical protein
MLNETRTILPDGKRYFEAGSGTKLYKPFYLRWLLPKICKQNEWLWNCFTLLPVFLIPVAMYELLIVKGYSETQSLIGCCLTCGLGGVILINYLAKYLTDAFGMLMMLLSLIAFQTDNILIGIVLAGVGSMANEKTFVYTALCSWNPLALIGGIPVLIRYLTSKPAKSDFLNSEHRLDHPFKTGWEFHKGKLFEIVLPWGVVILAFGNLDLRLIIGLLVAYGSIWVATDTQRLLQWIFVPMIIATVNVFPIEWALPLLAVHWFNSGRKFCV